MKGLGQVFKAVTSAMIGVGKREDLIKTMIGSLLAMQITLGILNVVLSIPMAIATLHNTVALLLLLSVITLIHKVFKPPLRQY
jgi:heme A synthase